MVLITCPKCEKKMSNTEISCPYCGYVIATTVKTKEQATKTVIPILRKNTTSGIVMVIIGTMFSLLGVLGNSSVIGFLTLIIGLSLLSIGMYLIKGTYIAICPYCGTKNLLTQKSDFRCKACKKVSAKKGDNLNTEGLLYTKGNIDVENTFKSETLEENVSTETLKVEVVEEKNETLLRNALNETAKGFIDSLKTENHRDAFDSIDNVEDMSENNFANLVSERSKPLSEFEYAELMRHIKIITDDKNDDVLSSREKILLLIQSMVSSHNASQLHWEALSKIDISEESFDNNIETSKTLDLIEIRFLSKIYNKTIRYPSLPGYFTYDYSLDFQKVIKKLLNLGYICVGDLEHSLSQKTLPDLKKILLDKGLKSTGNKANLVKQIMSNLSENELKNLEMQEYFALTEDGKEILKVNDALTLFYNSYSHLTTVENVIEEQHNNPNLSGNEILILITEQKLEKAETNSDRYILLRNLEMMQRRQKKENALKEVVKPQLLELEKLLEIEQEEQLKSSDERYCKILGISPEKREEIKKIGIESRANTDDGLYKQINELNTDRAGIIIGHNSFILKRKTANGENPYTVESNALLLLEELKNKYDKNTEIQILELFDSIKDNFYPNKLSLNYKALGEVLCDYNLTENAIVAFEIGLKYNPNLSVKRKLKTLKANLN